MGNVKPIRVLHADFGEGVIEYEKPSSAIVRFDGGIEEVPLDQLRRIMTVAQLVLNRVFHDPRKTLLKAMGTLIQSVNDSWGVFNRTRIQLLPHQLWVCRRVTAELPARWLIADDVGLGKTIEAGLILLPLISRSFIGRFLIICPASLVRQWQERLYHLFGINCRVYSGETGSELHNYWQANSQVIVSIHTLRMQNAEREKNLKLADSWDLVIVDEAHHLNADARQGPTLGYKVIDMLQKAKKIKSMLFFTGTPHRGKTYGFISLLHLLRPDLFDPKKDLIPQQQYVKHVLIRNNKQNVTDINGKRLFYKPLVDSVTFSYSPEEQNFYDLLTDFIISGKAYSRTLNGRAGTAVMLVLIAMQKLASSSVAAIRSALHRRKAMLADRQAQVAQLKEKHKMLSALAENYEETEGNLNFDELSRLEESDDFLTLYQALTHDEEERISELINAADRVIAETKINAIIRHVRDRYPGQQIVFFTEYKATQALLVSSLFREFGDRCAAFINGDDKLDHVVLSNGSVTSINQARVRSAEDFNNGIVRFIVSTEAGGEGIDLQERCHVLFHADLPWNPMRMHQRVGRINRFGQKHQVEVVSFRNPGTVESRIWEKLDAKIRTIMEAVNCAMDEPEDLLQLVLGMTDPRIFDGLYSDAAGKSGESLDAWFESATAKMGGQDVFDAVRTIVGEADRFDFGSVSPRIPRLDLADLEPFFTLALAAAGRRVKKADEGLSFLTPEPWLDDPALMPEYSDMVFHRERKNLTTVIGVGHKLLAAALRQVSGYEDTVAILPAGSLEFPLFVFKVYDSITGSNITIRKVYVGLAYDLEKKTIIRMYSDWEMLKLLNQAEGAVRTKRELLTEIPDSDTIEAALKVAEKYNILSKLPEDINFTNPVQELAFVLWC